LVLFPESFAANFNVQERLSSEFLTPELAAKLAAAEEVVQVNPGSQISGKPSLRQFRVTWRRIGEEDTFHHLVLATTLERARQASLGEIEQAIGPNIRLWEIQSVADLGPAYGFISVAYPS
jgi:hypothetical protein